MADPLMLYGATGYTGRLILDELLRLGLRPLLAGRDDERLAALARPLGLDHRAAALTDGRRLEAALRDVRVVLHAAGPFSVTSGPMVDACLRAGVHYLDVTGELLVIEQLARRDTDARRRGIVIMPGVGFDVVPSDCLAAHVARRLPGARRLSLGISGLRFATRGSASTLAEYAAGEIHVRRDGVITRLPAGSCERGFDYGEGVRASVAVSWGDVASAYYTTGIPDITVYFEATPIVRGLLTASRYFGWLLGTGPWQAWLKASAGILPAGPSDEDRAAARAVVVAEAESADGVRASARVVTPEAYTFTGMAAAAVARRVLLAAGEPGFRTPGRSYGPDFVLTFGGVTREDLD